MKRVHGDVVPTCIAVPTSMRIIRHEAGISRHEAHNCMRRHTNMRGWVCKCSNCMRGEGADVQAQQLHARADVQAQQLHARQTVSCMWELTCMQGRQGRFSSMRDRRAERGRPDKG